MMTKKRILWVDDEIDLLRAHVRLLEEKGYSVEIATNGEDALEMTREKGYDLVFLDEMMPGMGGLQTLSKMKDLDPKIPIVMVTKNEAESLMEEAIGGKISDYLTKPVNPSQVLLACKKILEGRKITSEHVSRDYSAEFGQISLALMNPMDHIEWYELYSKLTNWDMELDAHPELGLRQTLLDQKRECNAEFGKYVEKNYRSWIDQTSDKPVLSTQVVEQFVIPEL
jgi:CheY-like chemotaxis protein